MNADLKKVAPDYLGADLSTATFWTESARCVTDEPSRNRRVRKAALATEREREALAGRAPLIPKEEEQKWRRGEWIP